MTVNDYTTGICLLCYKQITSIAKFRERCARADLLLKKQRKKDAKPENILLSQKDGSLETECIPLVDYGDEDNVIPSNSLWTKDASFGEISGEWFVQYAKWK